MGRKIPGKKHRGVKDPDKQRATRFKSIADKINQTPKDPDDQIVSNSLKRIIDLKEKAKCPINKPRKKKPPPRFVQKPGEKDRNFLYRIQKECDVVIKEAAFEKKYNVSIKRNPTTGKVEKVVKAEKDELVEYLKKAKKEKEGKSKKKRKGDDKPRLTKSQKRKIKLDAKKEKKKQNKSEIFEVSKDHVKFGEVVHEPPTLPAPRKKEQVDSRKPGVKDLLMKSLLQPESCELKNKNQISKNSKKIITNVIDKKSKRKNLPVGVRRQLEENQKEVIQIYRQLKADKLKNKI